MIPGLSIIFMAISAVISIGLPIALFLIWQKRYKLKAVPLLVGAGIFILFALILQQFLHMLVLRPNPDGSINLIANDPALYVLYGILAAGIFEETGRFVAFHFLKKRYNGIGTGISYGIGHGGVEAILLAGLAMISIITMSVVINTGNLEVLGDDPAVIAQINALINTESSLFLASGIERVIAISAHISLSILVWCAVKIRSKLWLYPAAIILHAIVNLVPAMFQAGVIGNIWLVEGIIVIPATLTAIAAYFACKTLWREENAEPTPPDNPEEHTENEEATEAITTPPDTPAEPETNNEE